MRLNKRNINMTKLFCSAKPHKHKKSQEKQHITLPSPKADQQIRTDITPTYDIISLCKEFTKLRHLHW